MSFTIVVDKDTDTKELEAAYAALGSLLGRSLPTVTTQPVKEENPAPKAAPTSAKKAAPKPKPAPEPEPEAEEDGDEDLMGGNRTIKDALAAASVLVSAGRSKEVKKVLTSIGANRVSEIPADKIDEFINAIEAL